MSQHEKNQLHDQELPLSTASVYNLTSTEERQLLVEAENDDGTAAFRLYRFYLYTKSDAPEAMKWLKKSAARGNMVSQYHLGMLILEKVYADIPMMNDPREGKYWLELSAKNGYIEAKEALEKLEPNEHAEERTKVESNEPAN